MGDRGLAEELAQEALIRLCQHWPRVRSMERPGGWLTQAGSSASTDDAGFWQHQWLEFQPLVLPKRGR